MTAGIKIKPKVRQFICDYFDGFKLFRNKDNLVDMGIVTDDFVFSLKEFIQNEFGLTISGEDFLKNKLSITNIAMVINQKLKNQPAPVLKADPVAVDIYDLNFYGSAITKN